MEIEKVDPLRSGIRAFQAEASDSKGVQCSRERLMREMEDSAHLDLE